MSSDVTWRVPEFITISCKDGPLAVPAHDAGTPGLVIHPQPGYEQLQTHLWVLAHAASGFALAKNFWFLGKGEARFVASALAPLADWTEPIDPSVPFDDVRDAFMSAIAWRKDVNQSVQDLVWHVGDDVITISPLSECDGSWHPIRFGWSWTYIQLAMKPRPAGELTVFHLSATKRPDDRRRIYSYEGRQFRCVACGADA
jgi:hypothetical protein